MNAISSIILISHIYIIITYTCLSYVHRTSCRPRSRSRSRARKEEEEEEPPPPAICRRMVV